jgi:hypothetical protein
MFAQTHSPRIPIDKLVDRIFTFRQLSRVDQQLLMNSLLSKDTLTPTENDYINRVFDAVQRGTIRVVD